MALIRTAIPKCPMRSRAVAKKRGFLGTAEDYARRFRGQRTVPPGCTLTMQKEAMQIVETCQREWPNPHTLPEEAEPYEGEVLDIEVVLKLVGPTFAPALTPGQMHCWVSDKAGGLITEAIDDALAVYALGDVWRAHEVDGQTYNEVASARSLTREQVRQRWARAARRLRGRLVKSGVLAMLRYAIGKTYVPYLKAPIGGR